jgi:hypothetical protein
MSAVILKILSAGAIYALINLGTANNINEALQLKNDKIRQVVNKDIVMACTALAPVYDSKGSGEYTFICDKDPEEDNGAPPPLDTTKGAGRRKSRKNRKSRRNRK